MLETIIDIDERYRSTTCGLFSFTLLHDSFGYPNTEAQVNTNTTALFEFDERANVNKFPPPTLEVAAS